jgi:glycosyltransferase involved in cell wall biosynthesis
MKILHINYSNKDGAGHAVRRLSTALNEIGIESEMIFFKPYSRETARIGWLERKFNGAANILFSRILNLSGLSVVPTTLLQVINKSNADVVHLHWINPGMLSIEQFAKIRKPLVWTFHDMWPICGLESYVDDDCYTKGAVGFFGLSRWVWKRKKKALEKQRQMCSVITPSSWMSQCAKESTLFRDYDITTLSNCLNLDVFKPMENREELREKYGLPSDKNILLFGAFDIDVPRKGGDLLVRALDCLSSRKDIVLAVFGRDGGESLLDLDTVWLGHIEGDQAMAEVCNCADVALVPSRQETFGQTASEPQACGIPVVAFDATGLKDIVEHKATGYLAKPFDIVDFSQGIEWILSTDRDKLGKTARERAMNRFASDEITRQALVVYDKLSHRELN